MATPLKPIEPIDRYIEVLQRAARAAVPTLSRELAIPRAAAGEAYAAAAGLVLAGLSRHGRRRPADRSAASRVVEKFARRADLGAAELAILSHLARPLLNPRLGGLLGDGAPRACAWLSARTGTDAAAIGLALAASAPLALGALAECASREEIDAWMPSIPDECLEDPERLLASPNGPSSQAFRSLRRVCSPWTLGLK